MNTFAEYHYERYVKLKNEADRLFEAGLLQESNRKAEAAQEEYYLYEDYMSDPPHYNQDF